MRGPMNALKKRRKRNVEARDAGVVGPDRGRTKANLTGPTKRYGR